MSSDVYDAIFNCDKFAEENDWTPRLYYVRQFLFFLAENRVQVSVGPDRSITEKDFLELKRKCKSKEITVRDAPEGSTPIPTKNNLRFIGAALKSVAGYDQPWIHYLKGLIEYRLNENETAARNQFERIPSDIRAQLWLARLDRDIKKLEEIHKNGMAAAQNHVAPEINSYSMRDYYNRDITSLYNALKAELDN